MSNSRSISPRSPGNDVDAWPLLKATVSNSRRSAADMDEDEKKASKTFAAANMSHAIRDAKYAVRGIIVRRAYEIKAEMSSDPNHKHPFNKIVFCNIGNPQAFASPPITFHRQVLACVLYPPLMDDARFSKDVIARAKRLLSSTSHQNIGAYTNSMGLLTVRQSVASYLEQRDGFPASTDHIFLTNGASQGIVYCLKCLISCPTDGILIPIPQYPLYSATIVLHQGVIVPYELNEDDEWSVDRDSIEKSIKMAQDKGITVKGICVINPGNPTGQSMGKKSIDAVLQIADEYGIVVVADEVYQENIYDKEKHPFVSFRKCLLSSSMKDTVELISVHSVSKGIYGECGLRGGYMELINIAQSGIDMVTKLATMQLCPNSIGQCMVDIVVNPPKKGDESYEMFRKEYQKQYESLKERAAILTAGLRAVDGISCNEVFGAMYAFPQICLPPNVVKNAKEAYKEVDILNVKAVDYIYCMELLTNYGVCVIPGSGFKQKDGTLHFRTTILPPKEEMQHVVESIAKFHTKFVEKYSN